MGWPALAKGQLRSLSAQTGLRAINYDGHDGAERAAEEEAHVEAEGHEVGGVRAVGLGLHDAAVLAEDGAHEPAVGHREEDHHDPGHQVVVDEGKAVGGGASCSRRSGTGRPVVVGHDLDDEERDEGEPDDGGDEERLDVPDAEPPLPGGELPADPVADHEPGEHDDGPPVAVLAGLVGLEHGVAQDLDGDGGEQGEGDEEDEEERDAGHPQVLDRVEEGGAGGGDLLGGALVAREVLLAVGGVELDLVSAVVLDEPEVGEVGHEHEDSGDDVVGHGGVVQHGVEGGGLAVEGDDGLRDHLEHLGNYTGDARPSIEGGDEAHVQGGRNPDGGGEEEAVRAAREGHADQNYRHPGGLVVREQLRKRNDEQNNQPDSKRNKYSESNSEGVGKLHHDESYDTVEDVVGDGNSSEQGGGELVEPVVDWYDKAVEGEENSNTEEQKYPPRKLLGSGRYVLRFNRDLLFFRHFL